MIEMSKIKSIQYYFSESIFLLRDVLTILLIALLKTKKWIGENFGKISLTQFFWEYFCMCRENSMKETVRVLLK